MRRALSLTILILFLMLASFITGRTCWRVEPYIATVPSESAELMAGKRCDWDLDRIPLSVLVDRLSEGYGVPVRLDEAPLNDIGVTPLSPVTLRAKQIELWEVASLLQTTERQTFDNQLALVWRGNIAWLMTSEHAGAFAVTRTYDVRALYQRLYGVPMPVYEFTDASDGGTASPPRARPNADRLPPDAPSAEEFVERICSLLRETVGVGSWKEDGGQIGSLRELNGLLIVDALPRVHAEIAQKLNALSQSAPNAFVWRPPPTHPVSKP